MMKILQIENRKGRLKLNDGVYKESADKLIEELETLYGPAAVAAQMRIGDIVCAADDALESVEVEINSPGGSVFEGNRIYSALRGMAARGVEITTTVNGLAASMGSVILMAGDKRNMTHGSRIMIHEASTMAWGDARTLRKQADLLEGISAEIAGIYAERTGGDEKAIRQLMLAETWMTADQAKTSGFVHNVIKDGKAKASAEIDIRAETPISVGMSLLAKLFPGKDESQIESALLESESLRNDLTNAQGLIESLTAQITAKDQAIAESVAKIAELTESHEVISGELATANAALESAANELVEKDKAIADAKESAGKEAAQILATIGQPEPLAVEQAATVDPVAQYIAAAEAGDRKLCAEIFAKHKSAILVHRAKINQ